MSDQQKLAALRMRVNREHEDRPMGCRCGAEFGDSIDRRCHLINQTVEAMIADGWMSRTSAGDAQAREADLVAEPLRAKVEEAKRLGEWWNGDGQSNYDPLYYSPYFGEQLLKLLAGEAYDAKAEQGESDG